DGSAIAKQQDRQPNCAGVIDAASTLLLAGKPDPSWREAILKSFKADPQGKTLEQAIACVLASPGAQLGGRPVEKQNSHNRERKMANHSRRRFMETGLNPLPLISLASTIPGFLERTARAAAPEKDGRVLVVIQLDGGNDGINTVVPFRDEGYAKHRDEL